jgi:hypothetical protein
MNNKNLTIQLGDIKFDCIDCVIMSHVACVNSYQVCRKERVP